MGLRSTTAVILLSIVAAACGSSEPAAAPASTDPAPADTSEQATVVSSIDELTAGTWIPVAADGQPLAPEADEQWTLDRKSTRLNSSHPV